MALNGQWLSGVSPGGVDAWIAYVGGVQKTNGLVGTVLNGTTTQPATQPTATATTIGQGRGIGRVALLLLGGVLIFLLLKMK